MSERTLKLLTEGSRHAVNGTTATAQTSVSTCTEHNGYEMHMQSLPSNQLRISSSGKLVSNSCCDSMPVEKQEIPCDTGGNGHFTLHILHFTLHLHFTFYVQIDCVSVCF